MNTALKRNIHHERGNACFRRGSYDEALDHYTRAIQGELRNPAVFTNRAACYYHKNLPSQALADAEKALALRRSWHKGYFWKGAALVKLGKLKEGKEQFLFALSQEPNDERTKKQLKDVKILLGESPYQIDKIPEIPRIDWKAERRKREYGQMMNQKDDDDEADGAPAPKKSKHEEKRRIARLEVDVESGLVGQGQILRDARDVYNVELYIEGQHCKLQIIEVPLTTNESKYYYWFIIQWTIETNRVPQKVLTELSKEEAIHSFKRMFRDRTGMHWKGKKGNLPGKYSWRFPL